MPSTTQPAVSPARRPPVLSDEEFDAYCNALARGCSETDIMAAFGIERREYWRVQCAANRRRNRQMWADTRQFREDNRRFEKWIELEDRALAGADFDFTARNGSNSPFRLKAVRRLMAYDRYDRRRHGDESAPA